jgi:carnitine-CoA ligase
MLSDVLDLTTPATIVVADEFRSRLDVIGDATPRLEPLALANGADRSSPDLDRPIEIWDVHSIAFTSGTTGRSKASLTTHRHLFLAGSWGPIAFHLDANDVFLVDLPLFHMAGEAKVVASVAARSKLAVRTAPAMTSYWETAKATAATAAGMISSMAAFLLAQPERPTDRDHSLRLVMSAPLPADHDVFMARFGIQEIATAYGSTEVSGCLTRALDVPLVRGSCGRLRDGYEVRLVDNHDLEVPDGDLGELVVRTDQPWSLSTGYVGDPAATAAAWRNGWFHTGDMFRRDAEGNYYFHDRRTDAVRRRGENISSFEVEREVLAFPGIAEVACVAVRCDGEPDDEVKVFLVTEEVLDLESLVRFLVDRMPHFMVPRYYEVVDALPKTATMRVEKHRLRALGNTASTWDCQASGLRVTASGLVRG